MYKLVFTVLLLAAQNSYSQVEETYFSARGAGTMSCGDYISAAELKNTNVLVQVNQWVWGYLASYSFRTSSKASGKGRIRIPDENTIELYIKNYCNRNSLSFIMPAVNQLIKESGGIITN